MVCYLIQSARMIRRIIRIVPTAANVIDVIIMFNGSATQTTITSHA